MYAHCDCPGDERSHGYTRTDDDTVFYWIYHHEYEGEAGRDPLRFREYGYPIDHPVDPPVDVREYTERWVDRNLRE